MCIRDSGDLDYRHVSAHAHRNVRRAGATLRKLLEQAFHDAVLQRMVGDDADAATGVQPADRGLEAALKDIELMVDPVSYTHLDVYKRHP